MRNFTREKKKPGASKTKKAIAAAITAAAAIATASTALAAPASASIVTAIQLGNTIHNPRIKGDPGWTPLAVTAPDPSYPGAHSTISEAAATVLSAFDGSRLHLAITLNGVTRTFGSFQAAANEAGLSRIWAGQHTRLDHQAGERLGGQVAAFDLGHSPGAPRAPIRPEHRASGASRVEAWVRVGAELRPSAVWPGGLMPPAARLDGASVNGVSVNGASDGAVGLPALGPGDPGTRVVPVRHGDDLLGAISLTKPREEALTSAEDSLLQHLASQAGLVMRNAQLTAELRASIDELPRVAAAAGRGPGRRAAQDRAEPARRRPAAADRAGHPARTCWPRRPTTPASSGRSSPT